MLRFKCIYCGQRILAPDNGAGKKGHCPKCRHDLRVPFSTKGRPAISFDKSEVSAKINEATSFKMPPVAPDYKSKGFEDTELAELIKEKAGWFIPVYDELSLFLMAIMLIVLYFLNSPMRDQINKAFLEIHDARIYALSLIFFAGLGLSIYHVFTTRVKNDAEKWVMLIFAVAVNSGTAIVAGMYVIEKSTDWTIIFPMWNLINAILLLAMLRFKVIDEECISNRDASMAEVFIGLIIVFILFVFCNYVFKLYWAITFSICIIYATSFDKALQSVFPRLSHSEEIPSETVG
jgi:hypothetical protein